MQILVCHFSSLIPHFNGFATPKIQPPTQTGDDSQQKHLKTPLILLREEQNINDTWSNSARGTRHETRNILRHFCICLSKFWSIEDPRFYFKIHKLCKSIFQIHFKIHLYIPGREKRPLFVEGQPAWVRSRSVWSVGEKSQSLSRFAICFWIQNTLAVLSVNNTSGWWFRPFLEKYLKPPPRILLQKKLKPSRYYLTVCNPVWSQPKTIELYLIGPTKTSDFSVRLSWIPLLSPNLIQFCFKTSEAALKTPLKHIRSWTNKPPISLSLQNKISCWD